MIHFHLVIFVNCIGDNNVAHFVNMGNIILKLKIMMDVVPNSSSTNLYFKIFNLVEIVEGVMT